MADMLAWWLATFTLPGALAFLSAAFLALLILAIAG